MKRISFMLGLIALSSVRLMADNLVVNGSFEQVQLSGVPVGWEAKGNTAEGLKVAEKAVTVKGVNGEAGILVQYGVPLATNKKYLVSYKARGKDGDFRVYLEWGIAKSTQAFGAQWRKGGSDWKTINGIFLLPSEAEKPYIVIAVKGENPVTFQDISISDVQSGNLFNADFSILDAGDMAVGWEIKGKAEQFKFSPNLVGLNVSDNDAWLINALGKQIPGAKYNISFDVKGDATCDYRVYYEWVQIEPSGSATSGSGFTKCPAQWTTVKNTITLPDKNIRSTIFVIHAKGTGKAEFRNLKIELDPEFKAAVPSEIGGQWLLNANSQVGQTTDKFQSVTVKAASENTVLKGVPCKGNQNYCLNYQVLGLGKSSNVTGYHQFEAGIRFSDGSGQNPTADDVWTTTPQSKELKFKTPENITQFDLILKVKNSDTVNFGHLKLTEAAATIEDSYRLSIISPFYRNNIYSTQGKALIAGKVSGLPNSTIVVKLIQADRLIAETPAKLGAENLYDFSFDTQNLPDGKYRIEAVITSSDAKIFTLKTEINKLPPAPNEVVIGQDRNVYVNNKVFFPIIMMSPSVAFTENSAYFTARSGFNTLRVTGTKSEIIRQLDLAQKFNLKLIIAFGHMGNTPGKYEEWKKNVDIILVPQIMCNPALLGYFLVDEPAWAGVPLPLVIEGYNYLKKLDPYHPVWINAAPRGDLGEHILYAQGSDTYGLDIYPVPAPSGHSGLQDQELTCVGKYSSMMEKAGRGKKPIWMMLQGFAWEVCDNAKIDFNKIRYPNRQETRFMVYDALTSGANAVGWWGFHHIENGEFYLVMFKMAGELRQISGLFTYAVKCDNFSSAAPASIALYGYQYKDNRYLIAINRNKENIKSSISGFSGEKITELGEDKKLVLDNGVLNVELPPLSAAIYIQGELPPIGTPAPPDFNKALESQGNPYAKAADRRNLKATESYRGAGNWIWDEGSSNTPGSIMAAARILQLDKLPGKCEVCLAADDVGKLYVNGNLIGSTEEWKEMMRWDITKYLHPGNNAIVVVGQDGGTLPLGVLAQIITDGQENTVIYTDSQWRTSSTFEVNKLNDTTCFANWTPAKIIAPYGSGAWGNVVRVKKQSSPDNR